ncbi:MAG: hypothetical protein HY890_06955 [Deltaproteobacteria bacterium]|nr:hypothetical protein [Deltaproteobacteria bacterium]
MKKVRILPVFEHRGQPIVPLGVFIARLLRSAAVASLVVAAALFAGMLGYHFIEGIAWVDAFLNASMILGGMGPVNELHSTAGKIFAGCYALFSGLVFIVVAGIFFAPILHRFLHRFHLEGEKK